MLDDKVELDVQISWIDPDTERFGSDSMVIDRGSARALTELAPGTSLYAHGLEMRVDGIEVSQDQTEIATHVLCNTCGHHATVTPTSPSPGSCPQCGSAGIADTGQPFEAVRLRRVFSEIRRYDAKISDNSDERHSTRFEVLTAVDFDPARLVGQWSVEQVGLGVPHYRRLPVRWFNLGRSTNAPSTRMLAGRELAAPLFRVCAACGKLDGAAGTNSPREHRGWCTHRTSTTEHTRQLALYRELMTQGVAISLPPSVTADPYSVPSLQAALLLGLRETMGGSPDHLRIEVVPHPLGDAEGNVRDALLLHDTVPGGTGYLTDLVSPARLWAILVRAARALEDCPCQFEDRASCHRCLLPFTRFPSVATRLDAIRALRVLLATDAEQSFAALELDDPSWSVVDKPVDPGWGESSFEQQFRTKFAERMDGVAPVKQVTGTNGVELRISAASREWVLRPQVLTHGTRPDFMLTAPGVPDYAIYTDGKAFHASAVHNNLADDAVKREVLRAKGIRVISIPWSDLDEPPAPEWLDEGLVSKRMATPVGAGISKAARDELVAGSLGLLTGVVSDPLSAPRGVLARVLPLLLSQQPGGGSRSIHPDEDLASVAAELVADADREFPSNGPKAIVYRMPHVALVARIQGISATEVALVLDDSDEALADPSHAQSWREWLRLSNVLAHAADIDARITVTSLVGGEQSAQPSATLSGDWAGVDLGDVGPSVVEAVGAMSQAGLPSADMMVELSGVMADAVWRERKLVLLDGEAPDEDADELRGRGWTVLRATADSDLGALIDEVRAVLIDSRK
ncbi:hypothetical protein GCM10022376_33570 [Yimella lutea]